MSIALTQELRSTSTDAPPAPSMSPPEVSGSPPNRAGRRVAIVAVVAAVVFGSALTRGTLTRRRNQRELNEAAAAASTARPRVTVAIARPQAPDTQRVLPGNALPLLEASLFARTTGYVNQRHVDIGDRVEEGQLLAAIDSPEIDDQLAQAQAALLQAKATLVLNQANAALAKRNLARDLQVREESVGAVTPQEIDERQATSHTTDASVDAAKASIAVAEAAVQRYTDLQAFERITAPFPGVITARNIDAGDLVSADSTQRELFHLMRTDVLRVFVNVPQVYATTIKVGQPAQIYRQEESSRKFTGKVSRTADALDPGTRTLLTEVQVPNPDNALRPGMYLQVQFEFVRDVVPMIIPTAALAIRDGAPRVAVLDDHQQVGYRTVELGRDYGAEIEVTHGLAAGESVVVHPGDDLPEGTQVEAAPLEQPVAGSAK